MNLGGLILNFKNQNNDFVRPWIKYYGENTPDRLEYSEKTMFEILQDSKQEFGENIAIDFMNKKISYNKLYNEVIKCGSALKKIGIVKGDRVTLCLPNIPQSIITFYAVNAIGAVANMIHPLSAPSEIEHFVNVSSSKCIFILDAFFENIKNINCPTLTNIVTASPIDYLGIIPKVVYKLKMNKKIGNIRNNNKIKKWTNFILLADSVDIVDTVKYSDIAAILYSGGTTGAPKGILLSNFNFNALAAQTIAHGGPDIDSNDSMLAVLPMFHGFGLGVCIHTAIFKAARIILVPRFNAKSFAKIIIKKKPAFIAGVPTLYEALLRNNILDKANFNKLKGIFSGGDSLPNDLKVRFDELLVRNGSKVLLREGFGLTECVTASALTPIKEHKKGSVGIPYPDVLYKIVEVGGINQLPYGVDGEICIFGPTNMIGYLDDKEETDKVLKIHEDGRLWLHTGDFGNMDSDGFIYFKLRIKRMLKCSGYSVYPTQIEEAINSHEAVALCCVIGVPDKYQIQKIKAFIVLKENKNADEEMKESILKHCKNHIAKWSMPKDIEFRESLPLTKVGKIAFSTLEKEELDKI